jgi:hypothetical protein
MVVVNSYRHAIPPLYFWKSIFFLSLLKNTLITGFFVCQRKGKFEIVVISIIFGKAVYFKMLYFIPEERNVLKAK